MTCEELLKALNDYVDDPASLAMCDQFAAHLEGCNPCQVVVDNIRQTIELYKHGEKYQLPEEFQKQLNSKLKARFMEKYCSTK